MLWDLFVSSKKREKQIVMMGSVSDFFDFWKKMSRKDTIAFAAGRDWAIRVLIQKLKLRE